MRSKRVGKLEPHMAQAADPHDPHFLAGSGVPVTERRPHGDARAQKRRNGRQVFRLVIDAKDEVLADNDMVRIAAVGWKARLGLHAHIGARQPVLAVLLKRSEEHTSELQSLMRISYAVFCLKKKKNKQQTRTHVEK